MTSIANDPNAANSAVCGCGSPGRRTDDRVGASRWPPRARSSRDQAWNRRLMGEVSSSSAAVVLQGGHPARPGHRPGWAGRTSGPSAPPVSGRLVTCPRVSRRHFAASGHVRRSYTSSPAPRAVLQAVRPGSPPGPGRGHLFFFLTGLGSYLPARAQLCCASAATTRYGVLGGRPNGSNVSAFRPDKAPRPPEDVRRAIRAPVLLRLWLGGKDNFAPPTGSPRRKRNRGIPGIVGTVRGATGRSGPRRPASWPVSAASRPFLDIGTVSAGPLAPISPRSRLTLPGAVVVYVE